MTMSLSSPYIAPLWPYRAPGPGDDVAWTMRHSATVRIYF